MKRMYSLTTRLFTFTMWTLVILLPASDMYSQSLQPDSKVAAFDQQQGEEREKNPSDLSFTIKFVNDQKQFRQGEVIRLEMRFAGSAPETYRFDAATYDRSGRLNLDQFHLEPNTGVSDPMRDHLGVWAGGLRGIGTLKQEPKLIVYELNEWFRFDQPGTYRFYITSPRVSRLDQRYEYFGGDLKLTSNIVEFEIVKPEAGWAEKELQKILKNLNGNTDRRAACSALRFLGTQEAVIELVRRYDGEDQECAFEYYAGLISTLHRDFAVETMAARLAVPDQAVSGKWFDLLVRLASPSWRSPDSFNEEQRKVHWQRYAEISRQSKNKYAEQLAKAVALKTGRARAISLNTLLELKWDMTKMPDISTFFSELPPQEQRRLLKYDWNRIRSSSLLPTLRRLYQPLSTENTGNKEDQAELRTLALQRIYDLAPEEGRRLILAEMKRSQPHVRLPALTLLPDKTLPELDQVFLSNFESGWNSNIHSALIERYGSPNLYARVYALLEGKVGWMACFEQSHLLAYCLRANAAGGEALLRQALRAREHTRCYPNALNQVAELHFSPEVEKPALEILDDSDPEIVISAIEVLGKYGSNQVEALLWEKLEQWHQTWNGRERELDAAFDNNPLQFQRKLESALQTALAEASNWTATPKELARLNQLCVTEECRKSVNGRQKQWGEQITLRFMSYGAEWGRATIGHYEMKSLAELKQRLSQFPKGTIIYWQSNNNESLAEARQELFQTLQTFLAERDIQLVP